MNNIRDAKALRLNHMIGLYEVVVEVQSPGANYRKFFGYTNVSLEVALSYADSWAKYEFVKEVTK